MDVWITHRYRHKKTGGIYVVVTLGKLEGRGTEMVVYLALSDSTVWIRPFDEFADGRFEHLGDPPPPSNGIMAWDGGSGGTSEPKRVTNETRIGWPTRQEVSILFSRIWAAVLRLRLRR